MKTETSNVEGGNKITVIYHSADFDGLFCREIARRHFGERAEYIGWDYKDSQLEFPKEGRVYVLDLSPECFWESPLRPEFLERLIWIDHHKSAIDKFPNAIPGYRINGVAACRLTYQWFFGNPTALISDYVDRFVNEPFAVQLAGEYDVWDKRNSNADMFQFGLRLKDLTTDDWNTLLDRNSDGFLVQQLLRDGHLLQRYQQSRDKSAITKLGFTVKWEGLTFLCCNASMYNSHLFTAGILPEHEGLLGFNFDGERFNVSLYGVPGKPDVDLGAIATKYGGGGHKQACGFRCKGLPFMKRKRGTIPAETTNPEKKPRLFYYEDAENCWAPVMEDEVPGIINLDLFCDHLEEIDITFKRFDMTDAEFAAIPEI